MEKCDVTLSRAIQPLTSDVLHLLNFSSCVSLSLSSTEDLLLEKIVRGYKTGRGKRQSKWLWNLWKWRMTPVSDNFLHQVGSLTTWKYTKTYIIQSSTKHLQKGSLKKKAQSNFLQTTRKPGIILIIFIMVLTIFFFAFIQVQWVLNFIS